MFAVAVSAGIGVGCCTAVAVGAAASVVVVVGAGKPAATSLSFSFSSFDWCWIGQAGETCDFDTRLFRRHSIVSSNTVGGREMSMATATARLNWSWASPPIFKTFINPSPFFFLHFENPTQSNISATMMKVSASGKELQVRETNQTFRGEEKGAVGVSGIAVGSRMLLQVAKKTSCSVNIVAAGPSAVHKHQQQTFPKGDTKSKPLKEEDENTRTIDKENSRPESDWRSNGSIIKSTPSAVQKNSVHRRDLTDQKKQVSCPTTVIKNIIQPIDWDDAAFTLDFETKYHVLDASYVPPFPESLPPPTLRPPPLLAAAARTTTTKTKPKTDAERS
jgi:hypothetical protein